MTNPSKKGKIRSSFF
jgi:hypothetical protein